MDAAIDYLLEGDPAIRWQVMRDLTDAAPAEVAAARARVAHEGWGAQLLALQEPDGRWDGGTYRPGWAREDRPFFDAWTATHFSLQSLVEFGVDPNDHDVHHAIALVRDHVRWHDVGRRYFDGEIEPCINGVALSSAAYFGQEGHAIVDTLLRTQLDDGGWNCWSEYGARVSSFHSTICALEGLREWEAATGGTGASAAARHRGEEYLLDRALLRRRSDGSLIDPRFTMLSAPVRWFYDVLRGLDYMRLARPSGDDRCAEAVEIVRAKRRANGVWNLELAHEGPTPFDTEREGAPSRWVTLRALRVLRWADAASVHR